MFEIIESYILSKVTDLNSTLQSPVKVNRIENEFQADNVSASKSEYNYQLYITDLEFSREYESAEGFTVRVNLELFFNVVGKDQTAYKAKFDNYLFPLVQLFVNDSRGLNYRDPNNTAAILASLEEININNADRFQDEYYRPTIGLEFTGWIEPVNNIQFSKLSGTGT